MIGLKKIGDLNLLEKKMCIDPSHKEISIAKQAKLLGLNRSSYYFQPMGEMSKIYC